MMLLNAGLRGYQLNGRGLLAAAVARAFSGRTGFRYVPRPEYLYQDILGTTKVSSDGDPVALMLDLSRGGVRGPELITNGGFDTDLSGWSVNGVVWDNGVARENVTDGGSLQQNVATTIGQYYEARFEIGEVTGGSPSIQSPMGTVLATYNTDGQKSVIFKATANGQSVGIVGANATYTIDNFSVRELPGNHATQAEAGRRPVYRTSGGLHWLEYPNGGTARMEIPASAFTGSPSTFVIGWETADLDNWLLLGSIGELTDFIWAASPDSTSTIIKGGGESYASLRGNTASGPVSVTVPTTRGGNHQVFVDHTRVTFEQLVLGGNFLTSGAYLLGYPSVDWEAQGRFFGALLIDEVLTGASLEAAESVVHIP